MRHFIASAVVLALPLGVLKRLTFDPRAAR